MFLCRKWRILVLSDDNTTEASSPPKAAGVRIAACAVPRGCFLFRREQGKIVFISRLTNLDCD